MAWSGVVGERTVEAVLAVLRLDRNVSPEMARRIVRYLEGKESEEGGSDIGRIVSRREAAKMLGICPTSLDNLRRAGKITPVCFGKSGKVASGYRECDVRKLMEVAK